MFPFEPDDEWPFVNDSVELSPEEGLTRRRERPVDVLIALDDGEEVVWGRGRWRTDVYS